MRYLRVCGLLFETYNIGGHNEKQDIEIVQTITDVLGESFDDSDPRKAKLTYDLIKCVEDELMTYMNYWVFTPIFLGRSR